MDHNTTFVYRYSAKENKEIQEIRKKYLPKEESKLDELKRLDGKVQNSGVIEALCVGIIGCLIFGTGMCLTMQVIGSGALLITLGVIVGLIGMGVMLAAYPIYRRMFAKAKEKYAPRILELTEELSGEKI
ncbi:MAG: dihydropteridine reductase [Clostridia bacterium]|nr:dihydropteridine reductase [Clostridia bacterium]